MLDYISISTLNDFIFCPYSIYLHNVYMGGDEELIHASPQVRGKIAYVTIDEKRYSSKKDEITAFSVYSEKLGVIGKIDLYMLKDKTCFKKDRIKKLETVQVI